MPHILISDIKRIQYPIFKDGVLFVDEYRGDSEDKILVEISKYRFFLTKIKKGESFLIKTDSVTRVAINELLKKALKTFATISGGDILFSNVEKKDNIKLKDSFLKDISFFKKDFLLEFENIYIEVGFGSGRHLLFRANEEKDSLFIGLEIHTPSINQVLKQIKLQNLNNVYLLNYDARLFLELVVSNVIDKIFVHFPIPWDKKPHRRVINKEFVNEALRVLKVNGNLEIRTDSKNYFDYTKDIIESLYQYDVVLKKNNKLEISSKYEDRWVRQNKDIWDVIIYSKKLSVEKNFDFDFDFDSFDIDLDNIEKKLQFNSIKLDKYFIHFKKVYKKDRKNGFILVCFGDFNRGVTKYLEVNDGKISYFLSKPIAILANIKSHKFMNSLL